MIKVKGRARLDVEFEVTLNMTKAQFLALDKQTKFHSLDAAINWHTIMGDANVDEIEVNDLYEAEEER